MTPDYATPDTQPVAPVRPKLELPAGWVDPPPLTEEEMRRMDVEGLNLSDVLRAVEAEFGTGEV